MAQVVKNTQASPDLYGQVFERIDRALVCATYAGVPKEEVLETFRFFDLKICGGAVANSLCDLSWGETLAAKRGELINDIDVFMSTTR